MPVTLEAFVCGSKVLDTFGGSDHCPISCMLSMPSEAWSKKCVPNRQGTRSYKMICVKNRQSKCQSEHKVHITRVLFLMRGSLCQVELRKVRWRSKEWGDISVTNLQVGAPKAYAVFYVLLFSINPFDYRYYSYRRKFRSQTSDNMDRWTSRGGKSQRREEKRRRKKIREEKESEARRCRRAKT